MSNLPTVDIKGKEYVMVKDRVIEFNALYPNGCLITEELPCPEPERVKFKAIAIPNIEVPARFFTGHSQAVWGDGYINKTSALENAETSAVGRALALMGIGVIESIASADEINKANNAPRELHGKKYEVGKPPGTGCSMCDDPNWVTSDEFGRYCARHVPGSTSNKAATDNQPKEPNGAGGIAERPSGSVVKDSLTAQNPAPPTTLPFKATSSPQDAPVEATQRTDTPVGARRVTAPQVKRLWAIANKNGWTKADVESLLSGVSPADLTRKMYDDVCAKLEVPASRSGTSIEVESAWDSILEKAEASAFQADAYFRQFGRMDENTRGKMIIALSKQDSEVIKAKLLEFREPF